MATTHCSAGAAMANVSSVPLHWQPRPDGGSRIPEARFGVKAELKLGTLSPAVFGSDRLAEILHMPFQGSSGKGRPVGISRVFTGPKSKVWAFRCGVNWPRRG